MSSILTNVESERGKIESALGNLPGYKGYKDKEMRRESDMILRDSLARNLSLQLKRLPDMQSALLDAGNIENQSDMGGLATALQTLIDKVKAAPKGYAGFFDATRIKEEELDKLMEYDEQLAGDVPQVAKALDDLGAAVEGGGDVKGAIKSAKAVVQGMTDAMAKRGSVITGV